MMADHAYVRSLLGEFEIAVKELIPATRIPNAYLLKIQTVEIRTTTERLQRIGFRDVYYHRDLSVFYFRAEGDDNAKEA